MDIIGESARSGVSAHRLHSKGLDEFGLQIRNPGETAALFREIFVERSYAPTGIRVPAGSAVIDVGANIGMFSLFAADEWPGSTIVAIEAVPELAEMCRSNLRECGAQVWSVACAEASGSTEIVYYPDYSILSGRHADPAADARVTGMMLKAGGRVPDDIEQDDLVELIAARMANLVRISVECRTLDSLLGDATDRLIGLVKVDVEGDELAVLAGGRDTLARAVNVIVEADGEDRSSEVSTILRESGMVVQRYQSAQYAGSSLQLVWGFRSPG